MPVVTLHLHATQVPLDTVRLSTQPLETLASGRVATLRIDGHRWYFLLDGRNGHVVDPARFNALRTA